MSPSNARVIVSVLDHDAGSRAPLESMLANAGYSHQSFATFQAFLAKFDSATPNCAVVTLSSKTNIAELQEALQGLHLELPIVFVARTRNLRKIVDAMKLGAIDLLFEPISQKKFISAVETGTNRAAKVHLHQIQKLDAHRKLSRLTAREAEVVKHVLSGQLNKQIAYELGTVEKTVKVHRSRAMRKLEVRSIPDLLRLSLSGGLA